MNKIVDIMVAAFGVATVLVLTRPGSQGPAFVTAVGNAATHLVQGASGQKTK